MADITLRTVTRTQGNNRAVKDGTVTPRGFTFEFEEVPVLVQAFRRMVRDREFDVCEMSLTTYVCAKAHGKRITALPVFLVRGFHHSAIVCNTASGIRDPRDLEGREVGVNRGYTVTTGVWARGILAEQYGVDLQKVTWRTSGDDHVAEYRIPPNAVPLPSGSDLTDLVTRGELPAAVGASIDHPGVAPLIPNPSEAGYEALRAHGLYPINHLVVVKDELLEAHPGLAADIFAAFAESKRRYVEQLDEGGIAEKTPTDLMYERVMELTGSDPLPYGVDPNRAMLDTLIRYAVAQKILDRPVPVDSLFHESTLELTA
jgi:4,5-dihydroxyphthalate decarboxylase